MERQIMLKQSTLRKILKTKLRGIILIYNMILWRNNLLYNLWRKKLTNQIKIENKFIDDLKRM